MPYTYDTQEYDAQSPEIACLFVSYESYPISTENDVAVRLFFQKIAISLPAQQPEARV
jgi:hypothetical protein